MEKPTISQIHEAGGVTKAYASMILTGARSPARPLAIKIYRATGWKHDCIAALNDKQIDMLEDIDGIPS